MKKTKTLFDREMARPSFRSKFNDQKETLRIELQILEVLERKRMTYETFAKLLGTRKSNISRDLKGKGLGSATLKRVAEMARVLGYDFLPLLLPRDKQERLQKLAILFSGT